MFFKALKIFSFFIAFIVCARLFLTVIYFNYTTVFFVEYMEPEYYASEYIRLIYPAITADRKNAPPKDYYFNDIIPGYWDQACPQEGALVLYLNNQKRYAIPIGGAQFAFLFADHLRENAKTCFSPDALFLGQF